MYHNPAGTLDVFLLVRTLTPPTRVTSLYPELSAQWYIRFTSNFRDIALVKPATLLRSFTTSPPYVLMQRELTCRPPRPPTDGIDSLRPINPFLYHKWTRLSTSRVPGVPQTVLYEREANWHERRLEASHVPTNMDRLMQENMSANPQANIEILHDQALCEVYRGYYEEELPKDDIFIPTRIHALFLVVHLHPHAPDDSPFPAHLKSPKIILEEWDGPRRSSEAPDWCISLDLGERYKFAQPLAAVFDLLKCASNRWMNREYGYSEPIRQWVCHAALLFRGGRATRARTRVVGEMAGMAAVADLPDTHRRRHGSLYRLVLAKSDVNVEEGTKSGYKYYFVE